MTRLIRFLITGGSALALDFGIYYILTRYVGIPYLIARAISLGTAFGWNFTLNRRWTFRASNGNAKHQAFRFVIVMTITSLLQLSLMHLGISILRLHDIVVLFAVSALITAINFVAHRHWTYAQH